MTAYLIRRLAGTIPLLIGISTLIFFVIHLAPGDPTSLYWNDDTDPEVLRLMQHNLGLDKPLPEQYARWIASSFRGEFGYSFGHHRPVADVIRDALPNTLLLSAASLAIIFILGIAVGIVSAVKQYTWIDHLATFLTFFFYSMPGFWFGLMMLLLFSYHLNWLPSSHMTSISFLYEEMSPLGKFADRFRHLILPALTLGLGAMAAVARYTRTSMLEVIRMDFIRTARAKGLPEKEVILRHALRNALMPVITLFGLYLPFLFSGAVLVETIFAWPGMGRIAVSAIFQRDYPLIMAVTFLSAVLVVGGNLLADLAYSWIDPRIRRGGEGRG